MIYYIRHAIILAFISFTVLQGIEPIYLQLNRRIFCLLIPTRGIHVAILVARELVELRRHLRCPELVATHRSVLLITHLGHSRRATYPLAVVCLDPTIRWSDDCIGIGCLTLWDGSWIGSDDDWRCIESMIAQQIGPASREGALSTITLVQLIILTCFLCCGMQRPIEWLENLHARSWVRTSARLAFSQNTRLLVSLSQIDRWIIQRHGLVIHRFYLFEIGCIKLTSFLQGISLWVRFLSRMKLVTIRVYWVYGLLGKLIMNLRIEHRSVYQICSWLYWIRLIWDVMLHLRGLTAFVSSALAHIVLHQQEGLLTVRTALWTLILWALWLKWSYGSQVFV